MCRLGEATKVKKAADRTDSRPGRLEWVATGGRAHTSLHPVEAADV